jgi:ribosomal protein S12 methylthiotransferase accessory factor
LELVERDAVSIWWYNRISRPVVRLQTFGIGLVDAIVAEQENQGRDLVVFDVTHDLGVPVFVAMSVHSHLGPMFGFGAHFDAIRALVSALTELGQALCFVDEEARKWKGVEWYRQPHLWRRDSGSRHAGEYPITSDTPTVQRCLHVAASAGLEVLVRDCTRHDIGVPVVRVMVPGLRHMWPRYGSGRLQNVPVKMGWLKRPTAELALNPEYMRS